MGGNRKIRTRNGKGLGKTQHQNTITRHELEHMKIAKIADQIHGRSMRCRKIITKPAEFGIVAGNFDRIHSKF